MVLPQPIMPMSTRFRSASPFLRGTGSSGGSRSAAGRYRACRTRAWSSRPSPQPISARSWARSSSSLRSVPCTTPPKCSSSESSRRAGSHQAWGSWLRRLRTPARTRASRACRTRSRLQSRFRRASDRVWVRGSHPLVTLQAASTQAKGGSGSSAMRRSSPASTSSRVRMPHSSPRSQKASCSQTVRASRSAMAQPSPLER